jgi:hypothetical protein
MPTKKTPKSSFREWASNRLIIMPLNENGAEITDPARVEKIRAAVLDRLGGRREGPRQA